MKFRSVLPYLMMGASFVIPSKMSMGETLAATKPDMTQFHSLPIYKMSYHALLEQKAAELRDMYVSNSINGAEAVNRSRIKSGYSTAVRRELPGAPVGSHCLYGQCVQLNRALSEIGDTMTIVPQDAQQSCNIFKSKMRKKYSQPEYGGCIKEGKMFASVADYEDALARYLARRRIDANTDDSVRAAAVDDFARRNFSADNLNPGAMLVVPRVRGSKTLFHAIMYLGRGWIRNGKFIEDAAGRHIYSGYNREGVGDLFLGYDTSNVFAADIKKIARAHYSQELSKIQSMSRDSLINYLASRGDTLPDAAMNVVSKDQLVDMACAKYFNQPVVRNDIFLPREIELPVPSDNLDINIAQINGMLRSR